MTEKPAPWPTRAEQRRHAREMLLHLASPSWSQVSSYVDDLGLDLDGQARRDLISNLEHLALIAEITITWRRT